MVPSELQAYPFWDGTMQRKFRPADYHRGPDRQPVRSDSRDAECRICPDRGKGVHMGAVLLGLDEPIPGSRGIRGL